MLFCLLLRYIMLLLQGVVHIRDSFKPFLELLVLTVFLPNDLVMVRLHGIQFPFQNSHFVLEAVYQFLALSLISLICKKLIVLSFNLIENWDVFLYRSSQVVEISFELEDFTLVCS